MRLKTLLLSLSFLLTAGVIYGCAESVAGQDTEAAAAGADVTVDDSSFRCLSDMTKVRHFFVDNLLGDLDSTVAVAESTEGGVYPPGSVVQLVPTEVMVKHQPGWNAATRDWEFFELDVSPEGTSIRKRGFNEVVNRFGGNCFDCHVKAEPQWDLICDNFHGCDPIPLTRSLVSTIQKTDPRCEPSELNEEDMANMKILKAMMGGASGS